MIIDCFPFFDEFAQLYLRMKILPQVDKIVLVESVTTQSGLSKPLHWQEQKDKLNWDVNLSKIVHVIVEDAPKDGKTWQAENFQRNAITRGLDIIRPQDDDTILISDADEIPILNYGIRSPISFQMRNFYYYLNLEDERGWVGTVATPYRYLKNYSPQHFRNVKDHIERTSRNSGYHFSWLGGPETIVKKFNSCIEPMDKSNLPTLENIQKLFNKMKDAGKYHFIHAEDPQNPRVPLKLVPHNTIINDDLYPFVQNHIIHSYGFNRANI